VGDRGQVPAPVFIFNDLCKIDPVSIEKGTNCVGYGRVVPTIFRS